MTHHTFLQLLLTPEGMAAVMIGIVLGIVIWRMWQDVDA